MIRGYRWARSAIQHLLGLGPPGQLQLTFTIQIQQQASWCWAAVASSISLYYDSTSGWTQCALANAELGQTTCCVDGSTNECNRVWYLDRALGRTDTLSKWVSGAIGLPAIELEVAADRLVGARIGWRGGGGHFVVIEGYQEGGVSFLHIEDPFDGYSYIRYDTFRTAYQGWGSWTHTYYTTRR